MIVAELLKAADEKDYEDFLLSDERSMIYASLKYRNLLREFLGAEPRYLICRKKGKIAGVLPSFLRQSTHGSVINSLPFYGSNGGVIEFDNDLEVRLALVDAFNKVAYEEKCISSTLISSPLHPEDDFYEKYSGFSLKDYRIGQFTALPSGEGDVDAKIMNVIHYKTRNLVRKATKVGVNCREENNEETLDFLISTHAENLTAIGGISKPASFFHMLTRHFSVGDDYKLFSAYLNGERVAALLVLYYNRTAEYFTPVIKAEHRSSQALSSLIFYAMKDAATRAFNWWNWGGTWSTQGGVYHFKSQWGTTDINYYYYTRILDKTVLNRSKEALLEQYPYFFVAPFGALHAAGEMKSN